MKKTMNGFRNVLASLLAALVFAACLAGCGNISANGYGAAPYAPDAAHSARADEKQPDAAEDAVETASDAAVRVGSTSKEAGQADMSSLDAVKELGTLVGCWSPESAGLDDYCFDTGGTKAVNYLLKVKCADVSNNPYGLTWRYGPMGRSRDYARLNGLYDAYVAACDWSLVFDVEFYKQAFPMLALQYNYDDELLAQHFVTVGVHEGRQGSEAFNLAAYMANCGKDVKDAFGDDYECYYFYYMLNQDTEKDVATENGGDLPLWLTVELTAYQAMELRDVNKYREEAGAAPVTMDPELVAFACWRSWHDASTRTKDHDWIYANPDKADKCLEDMDIWSYYENTIKAYDMGKHYNRAIRQAAEYYYDSPDHYETMVDADNLYFGCSDLYYAKNADGDMFAQFDIFTHEPSRSPYVCR